MSQDDKTRWNKKWSAVKEELDDPHELLLKHRHLLNGRSALDLACGRGQNALWLAGIGYEVLGVDISDIALNAARQAAEDRGLSQLVQFEEVDLQNWMTSPLAYDLVIVFRFLDRRLFPKIKETVKPGGWLFYHTRHVGILGAEPQVNPDYLLEKGELLAQFSRWDTYFYREGDVNAEIVTKKPERLVKTGTR